MPPTRQNGTGSDINIFFSNNLKMPITFDPNCLHGLPRPFCRFTECLTCRCGTVASLDECSTPLPPPRTSETFVEQATSRLSRSTPPVPPTPTARGEIGGRRLFVSGSGWRPHGNGVCCREGWGQTPNAAIGGKRGGWWRPRAGAFLGSGQVAERWGGVEDTLSLSFSLVVVGGVLFVSTWRELGWKDVQERIKFSDTGFLKQRRENWLYWLFTKPMET